MRDAGMAIEDRRYLLWLLEKYRLVFLAMRPNECVTDAFMVGNRQGHGVAAVASAPTPKKKYRGWGPKVQLGKRLR